MRGGMRGFYTRGAGAEGGAAQPTRRPLRSRVWPPPSVAPRRPSLSCSGPACAWQMAQASASAESGPACRPGQQVLDHHLHLLLGGAAGADHGFLDLQRGVFVHGQRAVGQRAQRRAPRLAQ